MWIKTYDGQLLNSVHVKVIYRWDVPVSSSTGRGLQLMAIMTDGTKYQITESLPNEDALKRFNQFVADITNDDKFSEGKEKEVKPPKEKKPVIEEPVVEEPIVEEPVIEPVVTEGV
jgi:hypothetical protein